MMVLDSDLVYLFLKPHLYSQNYIPKYVVQFIVHAIHFVIHALINASCWFYRYIFTCLLLGIKGFRSEKELLHYHNTFSDRVEIAVVFDESMNYSVSLPKNIHYSIRDHGFWFTESNYPLNVQQAPAGFSDYDDNGMSSWLTWLYLAFFTTTLKSINHRQLLSIFCPLIREFKIKFGNGRSRTFSFCFWQVKH